VGRLMTRPGAEIAWPRGFTGRVRFSERASNSVAGGGFPSWGSVKGRWVDAAEAA